MASVMDTKLILTNRNYEDWRFIVSAKLRGKDLWVAILDPGKCNDETKRKATALIVKHVGMKMIHIVRHCDMDDPQELWNTIQKHFVHFTNVDKQLLLLEISNLRIRGKLNIDNFAIMLDELRTLHVKLEAAKEIQSDATKTSQIITILMQYNDDALKPVIRDILKRKAIKFEEAIDLVRVEIHRFDTEAQLLKPNRSERNEEGKSALNVQSGRGEKSISRNYKCYGCGISGKHIRKDCWTQDKTCNKCGRVGHIAKACKTTDDKSTGVNSSAHAASSSSSGPELSKVVPSTHGEKTFYSIIPRNQQNGESSSSFSYCYFNSAHMVKKKQVPWIIDSGSTDHVAMSDEEMYNFKNVEHYIKNQNGTIDKISRKGSVLLCPVNETGTQSVELVEVLINPKATVNLFSISKAIDAGLSTEFTTDGVTVFDASNGDVVLTGSRFGNLFCLNYAEFAPNAGKVMYTLYSELEAQVFHVTSSTAGSIEITDRQTGLQKMPANELEDWHIRMGHLNYATLRKLIKAGALSAKKDVAELPAPLCHVCSVCNVKRRKFGTKPNYDIDRVGDLIIADTKGPFEIPSMSGYKYFILFVDVYSRKFWIHFLKTRKTDTLSSVDAFVSLIEYECKTKVRRLHTDNAPEFTATDFKSLMTRRNIVHTLNVFGTPQSGTGIAERGIQTVDNVTRCLLKEIEYCVPNHKRLWAQAAKHAVNLINLWPSPSSDVLKSRNEMANYEAFNGIEIYPFGVPTVAY